MNKVVAMYYMFAVGDVPALVGIFSSQKKAAEFLSNKDKRKYYMREYHMDTMLKD